MSSVITQQERVAAAILAIANSAFADGLAIGRSVLVRSVGNVSPIRTAGRSEKTVKYDDIPDCSALAVVMAVNAIPEFVVRLRESPVREEMMAVAKYFMEATERGIVSEGKDEEIPRG